MYQPSTDFTTAKARAELYRRIRAFFNMKGVLEVETPILSQATVTDVHLQSVSAQFSYEDTERTGYLHTSPEFAMKRLVAAWQEPIFQIAKVFRDNEVGKKHNVEFSMLEWYRPSFSLDELATELNSLMNVLFGKKLVFDRISYQQAFLDYADVEPFTATIDELEQVAILNGISSTLSQPREYVSVMAHDTTTLSGNSTNDLAETQTSQPADDTPQANNNSPATKSDWLDLLYSQLVEPNLGMELPTLIYDFPAEQAALARTETDAEGNLVAKRFELYMQGVELANAYDELTDSEAQRARFEADNRTRSQLGLPTIPVDEHLLAALDDMPPCSGISVGLDRVLMVMLEKTDISEVINFTVHKS